MAGSGSKLAVYVAIGANTTVTIAKFGGFAVSGSGALLSEAVHSLADVGNQTLLAVGMKKSQRAADEEHPFGYGQEAFVWALISAVGMFFLGCGVSITHGIQSLIHGGHELEIGSITLGVLIFSLIIEFGSLLLAIRGLQQDARKASLSFIEYIKTTDDPFGVAVLLEDGGAVFGVMVALFSVLMTKLTHNPVWDAAGTLAIGLLLGFIAVYLVVKNRSYLVGKAISPREQKKLRDVLEADPVVEHVAVQRAMVMGTEDYKISAEIDLDGRVLFERYLTDHNMEELFAKTRSVEELRAFLQRYSDDLADIIGDEIDRLESRIREVIPKAKDIDLEPD